MIVNYIEESWQIITQRSHGLLAAQLCYHWKIKDRPLHWVETIIATAEHDDASNELEETNLIGEHGGPINFSMAKFDIAYCDKLLNEGFTKRKYIASLIAKHILFLYAEAPEAKEYCKVLQTKIDSWLKELQISKKEIEKTYHLLEWCDAFSLLICQQIIQPEKRKIEISIGPDFRKYQFFECNDHVLTVKPWPFEEDKFLIFFESRIIKQLTFKNTEEFKTIFNSTPTQQQCYTISKK